MRSTLLFRTASPVLRRQRRTWPSLARALLLPAIACPKLLWTKVLRRNQSSVAAAVSMPSLSTSNQDVVRHMQACPGCGALAQTIEPGEAGYYTTGRKAVRSFIEANTSNSTSKNESTIVAKTLRSLQPDILTASGLDSTPAPGQENGEAHTIPFCDRCHGLVHHHTGVPIHHPSLEALQDTIAESPYKHNHIYHVIDAADFPMSLIPNVHKVLSASLQRSRNRRAKHAGYSRGRKTEISFIITRSDLLAPKKEQVDRLMTYLSSVLRDALGSYAQDARLGNVKCVSAKRGWWTRELKADIWERGGGGWMVGKVNVGKSNLFEAVFPKGRSEDINIQALRSQSRLLQSEQNPGYRLLAGQRPAQLVARDPIDDEDSLLPPARDEVPYPIMPTISSLPGTTASPIRIPFGNGKGELIDLPGLERSSVEFFIQPEHRESLVMRSRIVPEQYSLKGGRSLLLSDLIRITPVDPDIVILACPFVPLAPHLTSKGADIQAGVHSERTGLSLIMNQAGQRAMHSAGIYKLRWDVTKQRAGPLTTKAGVGLKTKNLPFMVLSTDILIEGVGWVELVAQVRKKRPSSEVGDWQDVVGDSEQTQDEPEFYPEVEVFSPEGKFIGARRPMGAWLLNSASTKPGHGERTKRPRRSMATVKLQRKPL